MTRFLLHPEARSHVRALASEIDAQYSAVWRELNNLEEAGLLQSETMGGRRVFTLNRRFPIISELRGILLKTIAAGDLVRGSLGELRGLRAAFIFGSFAEGQVDADSDLDLMLVGDLDVAEVTPVIEELEKRLAREVNYVLLTQKEWEFRLEEEDSFATNLRDAPKVMLIGTQDDL
jgi:predicted nucleotidyltransferase